MDHVRPQLGDVLGNPGGVQQLRLGAAQARPLRLVEGGDQPGFGLRSGSSEQGDLVAAAHQPVGELGDDRLDAAVTRRWDRVERGRHHRDAQGRPQRATEAWAGSRDS